MRIIAGTNKLGTFLTDSPDDDSEPICGRLDRDTGRIVYSMGGRFAQEIQGKVKIRLENYIRIGRTNLVRWIRFAETRASRSAEGQGVLQYAQYHVADRFGTRVTKA